jgi:O-antigen ligase
LTIASIHPADLEPTLLAERVYATRRRKARVDTAFAISGLLVLLYVLPATLIVPGLTFAGRPALVMALGMFAWWVIARLSPWLLLVGPQPLRWACLFYVVSIMLSYLAGLMRGLPTLEANRQDFTVLVTLQFIGLVLIAADGLGNWQRLRLVLRVFVWVAAFCAIVAVIQSTFKFDLSHYLALPGLEFKSDPIEFAARGTGQFRVAGTTTHYIEFSTVMAVATLFAIHFALFSPTKGSRRAYLFLGLIIAGSIPMAISRTGIVALAAGVAVMFVTAWSWRVRYNVMALGLGLTAALFIVKPGLLGTLKAMFTWFDADPSVQGRTIDYEFVAYWFSQRPLLGRGPGTLIPEVYIYLDNEWLMHLVTLGLLGVVALATLHLTCVGLAVKAMRRSTRAEDRHLCAALIAVQIVAMLVAATFDSFSFTTFSFTLALMSGLCGAVWRFTHPARTVRTSTVRALDR